MQNSGCTFGVPRRLGVLAFIPLYVAAFAGGCAPKAKGPPLPRRGDVVAQGTGPLSFRTSERGLVSVYDEQLNAIVHSSGVGPASVITVTPSAGTITVTDAGAGTQTVYSGLNKSHRYEIWFIPATQQPGATAAPGTTRITN